VPIHVISVDDSRKRGLRAGAYGYLEKPVDRESLFEALARTRDFIERPVRTVLLVEDDDNQRASIEALIGSDSREVTGVGTATAALEAIQTRRFDCAIVDLGLPDLPGADLIERMRKTKGGNSLPILVYTGRSLSPEEERRLSQIASTVLVKGDTSNETLLMETAAFLHQNLREERSPIVVPTNGGAVDGAIAGRRVLVVDDDMRNIFSLTAALEQHGLEVVFAENGREGIERLSATPGIALMLVDIMMPEMDGYETMREVRKIEAFRDLPIVAVTAKAMVGDREKCLEAGADDYVSKPIDMDHLLAVLRTQLLRPPVANGAGHHAVEVDQRAAWATGHPA
jgi:CheY-like chemotaxis protein